MPANSHVIGCSIVAAVLLVVGPAGQYAAQEDRVEVSPLPELTGCATAQQATVWEPRFVAPDLIRSRAFECDDGTVDVRVAVWFEQRAGKEAVSEQNRLTSDAWRFTTKSSRASSPGGVPLTEHDVRLESQRLIIWAGYSVGSDATDGDLATKWREGINAARLQRAPTAVLAIAAQAADEARARRLLVDHTDAIWSWYRAQLNRS